MPCRMTRRESGTLGMTNSHAAFVTSIVICVMYHDAYERMGRLKMATATQRTLRLEDLDDTVLFDVFYESGTMLGGWLVALKDKAREQGDSNALKRWGNEHDRLLEERNRVDAFDRDTQIACKLKWDARRKELDALLD